MPEAPPGSRSPTTHSSDRRSRDPLAFHQSLPLAVVLFGFWVILSGKLDAFHLGAGAASALAIAGLTRPLYALEPDIGPPGRHPFSAVPWHRLAGYLPWLGAQIVSASVQVARIVLRREMPIQPQLIRFRKALPHNFARATLANSITLTPGTVTIDVEGEEYLVHALTDESARALTAEEALTMRERVERVFRP